MKSMMQKKKQVTKKKAPAANGNRRISIDIVTGLEVVSVYFDPEESVDFNNSDEAAVGKHLYEAATIIKDDGNLMSVKLHNGDVYKIQSKTAVKITEQDDQGVEDILVLREFSEKSLIHTLRCRYTRDDIYTFVGPILISINPYKWFKDLYTESSMALYHGKKQGELPPHLFVLADAAYTFLMLSTASSKAKDQSIIISGESGAGKTEATKVIMAYLAKITAVENVGDLSPTKFALNRMLVGQLEQKVLNTNPMLEAFGNARTLRNDNSSRFGKFIKIQFSKAGRIVGASIEKYLLEKTRIVHQMEGERNFHIFYQLLRGATPELKAVMDLSDSANDYHYLSERESVIPSISDADEFSVTCECMESIGIDSVARTEIFTAISGILQLGNITFVSESADSDVERISESKEAAFQSAARLLGLLPEELLTAITKQNMHVGGVVIVKSQTHLQAVEKRDSLARCIYSLLFSWLVDKINYSISAKDDAGWGFIGVLDIYGFENFQANGFEQLLINYANEKLQNHFNKHIFQIEQAEYESENIDWSYVTFYDNQQCVDLVDGKPNGKSGVFQTLDDASASGRLDVNSSFLAQLNQTWSGSAGSLTTKHPNYLAPRFNSDSIFGVLHYAGEVQYNIASFAEKNRDSTNNDMRELLAKSNNRLLRDVMECAGYVEGTGSARTQTISREPSSSNLLNSKKSKKTQPAGGTGGARGAHVSKLKEDSISKQFSASLRLLCDTLDNTDPHFVRCMKPNSCKLPNALNALELRSQLRNAGMMETIRIRSQGYAFRQPHKEFFKRYLPLEPSCTTLQQLVDFLSNMLNVHDESWQVGTTKLFIKKLMSEKLDRLLWVRYAYSSRRIQRAWSTMKRRGASVVIQKNVRRFVAVKKLKRALLSALKIQAMTRGVKHAKLYKIQLKSILSIQCMIRGKLARLRARRLYNPHNRMGYAALTDLLHQTEEELEASFATKNFAHCDALQSTIRDIQAARSNLPLPDLTPTSRRELDLMLLEAKHTLDHTVTVHDLILAGKLELRINHLEGLKSTLRTVDERKENLKAASAALSDAMDRKEFKKCAQLQQDIATCEASLAEAITQDASCSSSRLSVDALKAKKAEIEAEAAAALAAKDFDMCASKHLELDSVTSQIDHRDCNGSLEIALKKLSRVKSEIEECRLKKNFKRMAELHDDLIELGESVRIGEEEKEAAAVVMIAAAALAAEEEASRLAGLKKVEEEMKLAEVKKEEEARALEEAAALEKETQDKALEEARAEELRAAAAVVEAENVAIALAAAEAKAKDEEEERVRLEEEAKNPYLNMTYDQLSTLIDRTTSEVAEAAAAKNYKLCSTLETTLERMTESRSKLPAPERKLTRSDLLVKITAKQAEIDEALAGKKYKLCDELNADLQELQVSLASIPTVAAAGKTVATLEAQLAGLIATKNYADCEATELEIVVAKALYEKLLLEEPKPVALAQIPTRIEGRAKAVMTNERSTPSSHDISVKEASDLKTKKMTAKKVTGDERPVSKLRPKAPITMRDTDTIFAVAEAMASRRADAALLINAKGQLAGIITDNDITRRVVSQFVDPLATCVDSVMTKNPKCVQDDDSALDALEMMVDNRFRHLPVLDKTGAVVGLLDIAKCLYDAISVLEKVQGDSESVSEKTSTSAASEAMMKAMKAAGGNSRKGSSKVQIEAMKALVESMFGGSVPTLKTIIGDDKIPRLLPTQTVRDASILMASVRKGILVMDSNSKLVGILTPKDLLSRVTAKGLNPDTLLLSAIMTPNPDCASADLTLLDALKEMHDQKFLHLPVRDESTGLVIGLVDVMELVCSTAGEEGEGGKGWRDFFSGAMAAGGDDRSSELSYGSSSLQPKGKLASVHSVHSVDHSRSVVKPKIKAHEDERPVSKLRPKAPVIMRDTDTIFSIAEAMASRRADAALLINAKGQLAGIITDNDITRRVVSQFVDPLATCVDSVMTKNPKCVQDDDSALDALEMMVDNRFRHLPVLDKTGAVVGLLDIAKCLYDAISVLDKVSKSDGATDTSKLNASAASEAMMMAMKAAGGNGRRTSSKQMEAMQALVESMFGGSVPTLKTIIGDDALPSVRPSANVREAAILMAEVRKGVLVMSADNELVGILTPKDLLSRVVAKGRSADLTAVSSVMTPNPDCASADLTLLDALKEMHDQKFLHLPVRDESTGLVIGLVDVMELVCSTAGEGGEGGKGWRDFFSGAMAAGGEGSQSGSESGQSEVSRRLGTSSKLKQEYEDTSDIYPLESNKQVQRSGYAHNFETGSVSYAAEFSFKVTDSAGNVHRLKSSADSLHQLKIAVAGKLNVLSSALILRYVDDDKDDIVLSSDGSLKDAVDFAKQAGMSALKLTAAVSTLIMSPSRGTTRMLTDGSGKDLASEEVPVFNTLAKSTKEQNTLMLVGGGVAAVLVMAAFVFLKSKK